MNRGRSVASMRIEDSRTAEPSSWPVFVRDEQRGRLVVRFPRHVTRVTATAAVEGIVAELLARREPMVVVADCYDVETFDPSAPVAALRAALPGRMYVESVELVVRQRAVQLAALAVAHVLGLHCTVRHERVGAVVSRAFGP